MSDIHTLSNEFHTIFTNTLESTTQRHDSWNLTDPLHPVLTDEVITDLTNAVAQTAKLKHMKIRLLRNPEFSTQFSLFVASVTDLISLLNDVYTEDLFTDDNGQYFTALAEDLATSDNNGLILSETNVSFLTAQFDELYNDYYNGIIEIENSTKQTSALAPFSSSNTYMDLDGKRKGPFSGMLSILTESSKVTAHFTPLQLHVFFLLHNNVVDNKLNEIAKQLLTVHSTDITKIQSILGLSDGSSISTSKFPALQAVLQPIFNHRTGGFKGLLEFFSDPNCLTSQILKFPTRSSIYALVNLANQTLYNPPSETLQANSFSTIYKMLNCAIEICCLHHGCPPSERFRIHIAHWIINYTPFCRATVHDHEMLIAAFRSCDPFNEDGDFFHDSLTTYQSNVNASDSVLGLQLHTYILAHTPQGAEGPSFSRTPTSTPSTPSTSSKSTNSSKSRGTSKPVKSSSFEDSRTSFHNDSNVNALTGNIGLVPTDADLQQMNKFGSFIHNPSYSPRAPIVTRAELLNTTSYKNQHNDKSTNKYYACFDNDGKSSKCCFIHGFCKHSTMTCFATSNDPTISNRPFIPTPDTLLSPDKVNNN
jgi:hypothetical protein